MKIDHLGYIVSNLEKSTEKFEELGWKRKGVKIEDKKRKLEIVFLMRGGYKIELVSPANEKSPYYKLSTKIRNSPYHWCYNTDNFKGDLKKLKSLNYISIGEVEKSAQGEKIIFLVSKSMGVVELLERKK